MHPTAAFPVRTPHAFPSRVPQSSPVPPKAPTYRPEPHALDLDIPMSTSLPSKAPPGLRVGVPGSVSLPPLTVASHGSTQRDQYDVRYQKLASLMTLLNRVRPHCVLCWFNDDFSRPPHALHACSSLPLKKIQPALNAFNFTLRFPQNILCFLCGVPHEPPCSHPRPHGHGQPVDPDSCTYPNIIKPLTFLVWSHTSMRDSIFAQFGIPAPPSLKDFCLWAIQESSASGHLLNLFQFLLTYFFLKLKSLSSPSL